MREGIFSVSLSIKKKKLNELPFVIIVAFGLLYKVAIQELKPGYETNEQPIV